MVSSRIRKKADSGNIDILRAMRARDVRCKQPSSLTTVKKGGGRRLVRFSNCPAATDRRTNWKKYQCSEWVCNNHCQDNSNKI